LSQEAAGPSREYRARRRTGDSEDHAFGQILAQNPAPARTERQADASLARPGFSAGQQ
jgi:hypothetical protein